jgi:hypothetical protein
VLQQQALRRLQAGFASFFAKHSGYLSTRRSCGSVHVASRFGHIHEVDQRHACARMQRWPNATAASCEVVWLRGTTA